MFLCFAALLFLLSPRVSAQTREYELKAAFLFNFAQFVEWPPSAFSKTNAPLVIGILGGDPFGKAIDDITKGESVRGHPLQVKRCRNVNDISDCHILFINRSEDGRLQRVLRRAGTSPTLTVSDIDKFAERGGMIRLMMSGNKVRFAINQEQAKEAGLQLSSKLLRLADITQTQDRY
jgi:hypothetical protein